LILIEGIKPGGNAEKAGKFMIGDALLSISTVPTKKGDENVVRRYFKFYVQIISNLLFFECRSSEGSILMPLQP
jgi:hypothetical protein